MAAHGGPPAMAQIELNDEERAVLRECRINSVYFRGLPLGAISVFIMRQAIKSGRVPHIKRFSGFYYPGIFALGFLSGIASYRKTCMDKIMRLENSQLADQVRSFYKKAGMTDQMIGGQSSFSAEEYHNQEEPAFNDDRSKTPALSSRDESSITSDRSFTMPSPLGIHEDDSKQPERYTSYEELRRRNRNQWMTAGQRQPVVNQNPQQGASNEEEATRPRDADDYQSVGDKYQSEISSSSSSVWSDDSTSEERNDESKPKGRWASRSGPAPMKNIYGDVLEK